MNKPVCKVFLSMLSVAALAGATPVQAHHAFAAEFDANKPVELRGVVTKARWVNPHSWLYVDVKNEDGSVTNWGFEFGAPNALQGRGLSKADLQVGSEVFIKGYRSKNGGAFAYSVFITLADGRSIQTGGAQDAPADETKKEGAAS
ncbi:MAG: hypothetical protein LBT71_06035 [Azoarcus sp.]|jgi:hypothetical protein|nr:hypothetical protein [Azoarcus sp.]